MRNNNDYNSAGFLALILVGIALIVAGLILMGDIARSGTMQAAAPHQKAGVTSDVIAARTSRL